MKLTEYFKKLESIAFGPWLNKYKKLFTIKELETDMFDIMIQAKNNQKHFNKELVILSNDVIETEVGENTNQLEAAVIFSLDHREHLYRQNLRYVVGFEVQ